MANNPIAALNPKQKAIAIVLVLVLVFILYEIVSSMSGGKSTQSTDVVKKGGTPPPTPAKLTTTDKSATTDRELELIKAQQEIQAKYVAALNELQMLKIAKDLAQTNSDVAAAKLKSVTAQKKIVELLTGPSVAPTTSPLPTTLNAPVMKPAVMYTVVSISQLQHKWSAVLSTGRNLYKVTIGDVLTEDGSRVVAIDRSSVTLDQSGVQVTLSLVQAI